MLVLSRRIGDKIIIGDNIVVEVTKVAGNRVSLGISAPNDIRIARSEIADLLGAPGDRKREKAAPADHLKRPPTETNPQLPVS